MFYFAISLLVFFPSYLNALQCRLKYKIILNNKPYSRVGMKREVPVATAKYGNEMAESQRLFFPSVKPLVLESGT